MRLVRWANGVFCRFIVLAKSWTSLVQSSPGSLVSTSEAATAKRCRIMEVVS